MSDIKVVFVSNILTPHQIPFCDYMYEMNKSFRFVQMLKRDGDWEAKGERIKKTDYPYLMQFDENAAQETIDSADVLLTGWADNGILKNRFKQKKINIIYLERFYKKGINLKNFFKTFIGTYIHHGMIQKYKPCLFCASAYCAGDAAIFGNYKGRTYKWGYFPGYEKIDIDDVISKKEKIILWAGRLIDWKHPDDVLTVAKDLARENCDHKIRMIGGGDMYDTLNRMVRDEKIDNVEMLGARSASEVRSEMMKADVFITTSDYEEGWGAVLNEAMSCGCAVIASHAAGSTPFLVKDGTNGLIYESGNVDQLTKYCKYLSDNKQVREQYAEQAYKTIDELWNPKTAAHRFYEWSAALFSGEITEYEEGPCSRAYPIAQKDMYSVLKKVK